jgi:hypothetical protein
VDENDIAWFEKAFRRMADEELGATIGAYMEKTKYFVDFLRFFHCELRLKLNVFHFLHMHLF